MVLHRVSVTAVALAWALLACSTGANEHPEAPTRQGDFDSARIPLTSELHDIAVGFGSVWVSGTETVTRIDAETNRVVARIGSGHGNLPGGGAAVALGEHLACVAYPVGTDPPDGFDQPPPPRLETVYRQGHRERVDLNRTGTTGGVVCVDPRSNRIEHRMLFVDWVPQSAALIEDGLWISTGQGIVRFDLRARQWGEPISVDGVIARGSAGSTWVLARSEVKRVEETGRVTATIRVAGGRSLVEFAGSLWVTTPKSLVRIDVRSNREKSRISLADPWGVATTGGSLWVTGFRSGIVSRIDPDSEEVIGETKIGEMATAIAGGDGAVWTLADPGFRGSAVVRIEA
jgi:hypothetical protein